MFQMGRQKSVATLDNRVAVFYKTKHTFYIQSRNLAPRYLSRWNNNIYLSKNIYGYIYSDYIHSPQKTGNHMSLNWYKNFVYSYSESYSAMKATNICSNIDQSQMHYIKRKKSLKTELRCYKLKWNSNNIFQ